MFQAQVMSCLKDVHIGMKVEVINNGMESFNNAENTTFWVASVINFKHFKALLRYEGYNESDSADFWFIFAILIYIQLDGVPGSTNH